MSIKHKVRTGLVKTNLSLVLGVVVVLLLACSDDSPMQSEPRPEGWISLGLADKQINRLVISGDWLYACTGKDGLYRIKHPASAGDQWQFLGLDDLEVVQPGIFGVTDVVAFEDTLVAGVWSGGSNTHGIFRSVDDGTTWVPSDTGFLAVKDHSGTGYVLRLVQSSSDPQRILAGTIVGTKVYISNDLGATWIPLFDYVPEVETSFYTLGFHPNIESEFWAGGQVPNSQFPFLFRSTDSGMTWQPAYEPPFEPFDAADSVNDIAFDPAPENRGVVYISLDKIILKTTNSGETWFTSLDTLQTGVFSNVSSSPFDGSELIACSSDSLFQTINAGNTWTVFARSPDSTGVMSDLVVDWVNRILYVSAFNPTRGVYQLFF